MQRQPASWYIDGVLSGDRQVLSRAITIVESTLPSDKALATDILTKVEATAHASNSCRIGFTGVPGVGKSTLIEALGIELINHGHQLAVLAIDPSSSLSKGSLLGDKTRMEELSRRQEAYIRPTASAGALGGLAHNTRQVITLCEAAGFDTIFVETVGVGQSEVAVRSVCDMFILLMLAGAGDELQGIKRGIMEMADLLVITKVEESTLQAAKLARASYQNALHLLLPPPSGQVVDVLLSSAFDRESITALKEKIDHWFTDIKANGWYQQQRLQQKHHAFKDMLVALAQQQFNIRYQELIKSLNLAIEAGELNVLEAISIVGKQVNFDSQRGL